MDDGTKIRRTDSDNFVPSFAENMDVKITSKCSIGCPFCYEGCTKDGQHASLFKYKSIETLHPYTELALNGNDLDHPELYSFLLFLKSRSIFTNITVNQKQFFDNYEKLKEWSEEKLIYGLGISYVYYSSWFINTLKEFPNAVIHTIVGILTEQDIDVLRDQDLKLLILGYKNLGRGEQYLNDRISSITKNILYLENELPNMIKSNQFKVLSFDNLALEQLDVRSLVSEKEWDNFYMGDDGQFTFYIDMVAGEFAKNSLSQKRYKIGDLSVDEMFNKIKTI
jgi:hypothetical protein